MTAVRQADPVWWRLGMYEGRPLRVILRQRDIACLFRFLRTRGWSRSAIATATGLAETRVRAIYHGRQQVTSYEVLERIALGLNIDRGLLGLAYGDGDTPNLEQSVAMVDPRSREPYPTRMGRATSLETATGIASESNLPSAVAPTADRSTGRDLELATAGTGWREEGDVNRRQVLAGTTLPAIGSLITVMTAFGPTIDPPDTSDRVEFDWLDRRLARSRHAYQQGCYTSATQALTVILEAVRRGQRNGVDRHWAAFCAEAYQVASSLLLKFDEPVLAAISAERSAAAAPRSGDHLVIASSARAVVHCLMAGGNPDHGITVAIRAAEQLAADASMKEPSALSLYGALLLRGAIAAARREDREQAHALVSDAARAAAHLGVDRNLQWTGFGPANVEVHRVAIAVYLGDAGTAVSLARRVDPGCLPLAERRATLLLDTARALAQWGKLEAAFDAVREAECHAPEEVRTRVATHSLINELVLRSPNSLQRRVREYARTVGAA